MPTTRRDLLNAIARLGGAGAVSEILAALDFLKPPPALAARFELPPQSGNGKTVVILGAGVSGLSAAYELARAGYECTIIEPLQRAGGRCWTIRRGDSFREMPSPGDPNPAQQTCNFDDQSFYFNAGPGRIPHHHLRVLQYCRDFGVTLEPYIFASRANLFYSTATNPPVKWPLREPLYDLQGYVAELAANCKDPEPKPDEEQMLVQFGDLTVTGTSGNRATYTYTDKSARAGYAREPGVADPGKPLTPLQFDAILKSNVWNNWLFRDARIYWQTSLMQPTGGMDMFVLGILKALHETGTRILFGRKAVKIRVNDNDVVVTHVNSVGSPNPDNFGADYCISTIPVPIFGNPLLMTTNLSATFMQAAANLPISPAGKVGWQAEDRFWEKNYDIYGGISWTTDDIDQIWYPSDGYMKPKGVLTGAFMGGDRAKRFNPQPVSARLMQARAQGAKLHNEIGDANIVKNGLAIAWDRMEFERFAWSNPDGAEFEKNVKMLVQPQRSAANPRFILAGDQITYWSGWMEGAIQAAHYAATIICQHARSQP